jgi:hypothetical protein
MEACMVANVPYRCYVSSHGYRGDSDAMVAQRAQQLRRLIRQFSYVSQSGKHIAHFPDMNAMLWRPSIATDRSCIHRCNKSCGWSYCCCSRPPSGESCMLLWKPNTQ